MPECSLEITTSATFSPLIHMEENKKKPLRKYRIRRTSLEENVNRGKCIPTYINVPV